MKQSQFYYLLRRGLFSAGSAIIKNGLVMFNKFTTAGLNFPAQGSAEFDGASDYIQLPDPFSYTNHTIAAWVYLDNVLTAGKTVFDNRDANDDGIRLIQSGTLFFYQLNSHDRTATLSAKEWYFVVATYDGSDANLYVNGSLESSNATSQTVSTTTDARIGLSAFEVSGPMNGNLANVAIWNRALSSDEINSVMWKPVQALSATESNGLQAWYSLDDISGSSVPDSSGNGNDGTAN